MITHDFIRGRISHFRINKLRKKLLNDYITQQEKKDKLLDLYKDFHYGDHDAETDYDILKQIKALEKELK
jgi:hypothetical protein